MAFKLFEAKLESLKHQRSSFEHEEKYRLLHEYAGVGIGYYNLDGVVLSYNQLAAKHMGGVPDDFSGRSIHELFPEADAKIYYERIKNAALLETPVVYGDTVLLPSGNKYFLSTFTRIVDVKGNVLGIQIISQDISDRRNAEIALQAKNEDYEAINEELRSSTEELQMQNEELRQAHDLLIQSENRLKQAEQVAKIGNWILQLRTRTMIASAGADEIYGVDFQRVPLAEVQSIPLPEYRPALDKALSELITKDIPYDLEFKIRKPLDGSIVDIHSVATYDKKTDTVFGVIQDITKRLRSEKTLREVEAQKNAILNGISASVALVDKELKIIWANKAAANSVNRLDGEMIGHHCYSFWGDSKKPCNDCPAIQVIQTGKPAHRIVKTIDGRIWDERGEPIFDEDGKIKAVVEIAQDITQLKEKEESLKKIAWRMEGIIEGTHVGTWEWNIQTGEVVFNERWAEISGYTLAELEPVSISTWETLVHPDDLALSELLLEKHFSGAALLYQLECRVKHKDGHWIWVLDRGKVITWTPDGKPLMMFGTHTDIDEKKKAENRIQSLLAEKELLLKEVHHRIKNNMNTISSLLSLQASVIPEPTAVRALEEARNRIRSMSLLYDKLYRSTDFKELSIKEYLSILVDEVIANFPNCDDVTVIKNMDDFMLDAERLQALGIMVNELLTNTMKYAFKPKVPGLITVTVEKAGQKVIIKVKDNGKGIPEQVNLRKSKGFGLQLVQKLAEQLGGTLEIIRGNGSEVVLEFTL